MKYLKRFNESKRFTGPDGEFQPTTPKKDGEISIGYCEELLEWLYYNDDLDDDDKLERILKIENLIQKLLKKMFAGDRYPIYKPTWSVKLQNDMK
jgi:hypothetical protein